MADQEEVAQTGSESAVTESAAPDSGVETSSTKGASEEVGAESQQMGQDGGELTPKPEKPPYKPNYKIKVYDKDDEIKDEFLKTLIKDAETEKKVKEYAQKSMGFDVVKERYEGTRTQFLEYAKQAEPIINHYKQANKMLEKGDLDSFFGHIGIKEDDILRYAVQKAEERQLSPDQRSYLQHQRQLAQQTEFLESQNQALLERQRQQKIEFRNQELQWVLSNPEVSSIEQRYDSLKEPGSFKELVRAVAYTYYKDTGVDLSAKEAVDLVLKKYIALDRPANAAPQPGGQDMPAAAPQQQAPPVIPNVESKGVSPVRKQVKSIADIKKRYEELASQ